MPMFGAGRFVSGRFGAGRFGGLLASVSAIALIFANDEPGVWFDPSDLSTLYQDTAGMAPVTTAGQTVAVQLDKSKGLVLGPEEVTNGGFDAGSTGWTLSNGATISGGVADLSGSGETLQQVGVIPAGTTAFIKITWTQTLTSGTRLRFITRNGAANGNAEEVLFWTATGGASIAGTNANGSGTITAYLKVADGYSFYLLCETGVAASIDNVSVKLFPGNHATQPTAAKRPTYGYHPFGGVRNKLVQTENFADGVWVKPGVSVSQINGAEWKFTPQAVSGFKNVTQSLNITQSDNTIYIEAKSAGYSSISVQLATAVVVRFNLDLETAVVTAGVGTATITPTTDGFLVCKVVTSATVGARNLDFFVDDGAQSSFTGDGTSGIIVRKPQLEEGSTATDYQRVGNRFDVTEEGVPLVHYLWSDGDDDAIATPVITPGTDKMQVFAGVRKLSNVDGIILELSASVVGSNGSSFLVASSLYGATARGSASIDANQRANTESVIGADTSVITATHDIAGDLTRIRRNGGSYSDATGEKGTGNFLAYALYIAARAGTSIFFEGNQYQLIGRFGPNLDADTIANVEAEVAQKTGVTL